MYQHSIQIESLGDVTEQIEQERQQEYQAIAQDASMIHEIFHDISNITGQCCEPLETILTSTEHAVDHTDTGTQQLVKAADISKRTNKTLIILTSIGGGAIGTIIGGVVGSVFNIPGITVGAHIGLIIGTVVTGGVMGTGIGVGSALAIKQL